MNPLTGSVLKFFYPQHFSIAPPIFVTVIINNYTYLITRIKETLVTLSKLFAHPLRLSDQPVDPHRGHHDLYDLQSSDCHIQGVWQT
jgi:hypothetical protein